MAEKSEKHIYSLADEYIDKNFHTGGFKSARHY